MRKGRAGEAAELLGPELQQLIDDYSRTELRRLKCDFPYDLAYVRGNQFSRSVVVTEHYPPKPPLLSASPDYTPQAPLSVDGVQDDQDDEGQKGRELGAKERKPYRHKCVGLHMRHVDR